MHKNSKNISIILFLVGAYLVMFTPNLDWVGVSFFAITLELMAIIIVVMRNNVSLTLVYCIFSLVFLNLLPWIHYSEKIIMWRSGLLLEGTYYALNLLLFVCHAIIFYFFYIENKNNKLIKNYCMSTTEVNLIGRIWILIISCIGFFVTLLTNAFSMQNLLFRGLEDEVRFAVVESSALNLILSMCGRMMPFFCFAFAATQIKNSFIFKLVLFLILLISVFPTGVARYMVGMVYLPLALIFYPKIRDGGFFSALLIFSVLFLFPFLDQFRDFSGFDGMRLIPKMEYFYAAHFDAYENLATAFEIEFISNGWQLLGVFLFYVPRTFWPNKPIGSGTEMADNLGYIFNNISMPYLGEGYVNFGVPGVIFFSVVLGYVMAKIDKFYTVAMLSDKGVGFSGAFYFYLIGGLFFVLRGDLLSSFAYLSSGIFVAFAISLVMGKINKSKSF